MTKAPKTEPVVETTKSGAIRLSEPMETFILHWGEMGTKWGVNRSVAQVHGLLFLVPRPVTAEEIAETLSIARSNVSTSLKELQSWDLVRLVPVMGDRRDHYTTFSDPWDLFCTIVAQRRRREVDPILGVLQECSEAAASGKETPPETARRIDELARFAASMVAWHEQIGKLPRPAVKQLVRLGGKVTKALPKGKGKD